MHTIGKHPEKENLKRKSHNFIVFEIRAPQHLIDCLEETPEDGGREVGVSRPETVGGGTAVEKVSEIRGARLLRALEVMRSLLDREPVELQEEGVMWSLERVQVSNQAVEFCM